MDTGRSLFLSAQADWHNLSVIPRCCQRQDRPSVALGVDICAGCVPDHSLKFVVLDGQDLTPQSSVVELSNTLPSGGLLSPEAARTGDDLLVVSTVTYHTSAEGASGTIRCAQ